MNSFKCQDEYDRFEKIIDTYNSVKQDDDPNIVERAQELKRYFQEGHAFLSGIELLKVQGDSKITEAMRMLREKDLPTIPRQKSLVDPIDQHEKTLDLVEELAKGGQSSAVALQKLDKKLLPDPVEHDAWELQRVIAGHSGWVWSLDVDVSNEFFVTGSVDRLIKVWDLASGDLKVSLSGHVGAVRSVKLSDKHPYLFSCGEDNMVKCWDLEANRVVRHYHGHLNGVYTLDLHPSLDVLCSAGRDAVVRVWDMRTRRAVHIMEGHTNSIQKVVCQNQEPQIISGSHDKTIRCWDLATGRSRHTLTHHKKAVRGLSIHPNEYKFISCGGDGVKLWRGAESEYTYDFDNPNSILHCSAMIADGEGHLAVAGGDNGLLFFWDVNSGKLMQTIETKPQPGSLAAENAIYDLTFDRSETRLLTAECDKTIKVYRKKYSGDDEEE